MSRAPSAPWSLEAEEVANTNFFVHQPLLPFIADEANPRAALVARWLVLVCDVLPGMAQRCRWPISADHCFMRLCFDTSVGAPWHTIVKQPAIRHLTNAQLEAAIAVAEGLVNAPDTLDALNRQSIAWRRRLRMPG